MSEEDLEKRLDSGVEHFKKKEFEAAERVFSDLMVHAVRFYKSETHAKMAKFFYFYGDMLLSKLESNPDVFGEQAQKKKQKGGGDSTHEMVADNDEVEAEEEGVESEEEGSSK